MSNSVPPQEFTAGVVDDDIDVNGSKISKNPSVKSSIKDTTATQERSLMSSPSSPSSSPPTTPPQRSFKSTFTDISDLLVYTVASKAKPEVYYVMHSVNTLGKMDFYFRGTGDQKLQHWSSVLTKLDYTRDMASRYENRLHLFLDAYDIIVSASGKQVLKKYQELRDGELVGLVEENSLEDLGNMDKGKNGIIPSHYKKIEENTCQVFFTAEYWCSAWNCPGLGGVYVRPASKNSSSNNHNDHNANEKKKISNSTWTRLKKKLAHKYNGGRSDIYRFKDGGGHENFALGDSKYRYLNSGSFIGPGHVIKELMEEYKIPEMEAKGVTHGKIVDDQDYWAEVWRAEAKRPLEKGGPRVCLDQDGVIFQSAAMTQVGLGGSGGVGDYMQSSVKKMENEDDAEAMFEAMTCVDPQESRLKQCSQPELLFYPKAPIGSKFIRQIGLNEDRPQTTPAVVHFNADKTQFYETYDTLFQISEHSRNGKGLDVYDINWSMTGPVYASVNRALMWSLRNEFVIMCLIVGWCSLLFFGKVGWKIWRVAVYYGSFLGNSKKGLVELHHVEEDEEFEEEVDSDSKNITRSVSAETDHNSSVEEQIAFEELEGNIDKETTRNNLQNHNKSHKRRHADLIQRQVDKEVFPTSISSIYQHLSFLQLGAFGAFLRKNSLFRGILKVVFILVLLNLYHHYGVRFLKQVPFRLVNMYPAQFESIFFDYVVGKTSKGDIGNGYYVFKYDPIGIVPSVSVQNMRIHIDSFEKNLYKYCCIFWIMIMPTSFVYFGFLRRWIREVVKKVRR